MARTLHAAFQQHLGALAALIEGRSHSRCKLLLSRAQPAVILQHKSLARLALTAARAWCTTVDCICVGARRTVLPVEPLHAGKMPVPMLFISDAVPSNAWLSTCGNVFGVLQATYARWTTISQAMISASSPHRCLKSKVNMVLALCASMSLQLVGRHAQLKQCFAPRGCQSTSATLSIGASQQATAPNVCRHRPASA